MAYELHLRHYDRTGTLKNAVLNPLWARYTESVSGQEPLVFALDADHPQLADIEEFDLLEVKLRNVELGLADFTPAFLGIVRHWTRQVDVNGLEVVEFTAPHIKHLLAWRHVLWYTGVANRSIFSGVEAETIMKTVVDYNFTTLAAHTPGNTATRQRDGDLDAAMGFTLTTATDQSRGNVLDVAFSGANVLTVLAKLAEAGGGDFGLAWGGEGTATFDFEFHPGQLGADKSTGADRVLFSTLNNTMLRPRLTRRGADATVAIVAGKGTEVTRAVTEVEGPDFSATAYDIETFVDARNEDTADGRTFRGTVALEAKRVRETLDFEVLQTANQFYSPVAVTGRKTYQAGDLVLAAFGGDRVRKIDKVEVRWAPPERGDAFQVSVVTREVPG